MKKVRGFGYVEDVDLEDELEPGIAELEHGFASESAARGYRAVRSYRCPKCERVLFEADVSLHGVIFIRCRKCRREVAIETSPIMSRIGFINTLQKEKQQNDS